MHLCPDKCADGMKIEDMSDDRLCHCQHNPNRVSHLSTLLPVYASILAIGLLAQNELSDGCSALATFATDTLNNDHRQVVRSLEA